VYLGRISYGLYMFHNFVPDGVARLLRLLHLRPVTNQGLAFTLNLSALILAASVSWHLFEGPINRLKRFFPYAATRVQV